MKRKEAKTRKLDICFYHAFPALFFIIIQAFEFNLSYLWMWHTKCGYCWKNFISTVFFWIWETWFSIIYINLLFPLAFEKSSDFASGDRLFCHSSNFPHFSRCCIFVSLLLSSFSCHSSFYFWTISMSAKSDCWKASVSYK